MSKLDRLNNPPMTPNPLATKPKPMRLASPEVGAVKLDLDYDALVQEAGPDRKHHLDSCLTNGPFVRELISMHGQAPDSEASPETRAHFLWDRVDGLVTSEAVGKRMTATLQEMFRCPVTGQIDPTTAMRTYPWGDAASTMSLGVWLAMFQLVLGTVTPEQLAVAAKHIHENPDLASIAELIDKGPRNTDAPNGKRH